MVSGPDQGQRQRDCQAQSGTTGLCGLPADGTADDRPARPLRRSDPPVFWRLSVCKLPDKHSTLVSANSTYGVSRLVSFGGRPAPVPDQIIASLQDSCDENGTISLDRSISPGDEVEIAVGAMKDFVGRVEHLAPNHRAIVLLDFMGKQTKMVVNKAYLRAASGRSKQPGGR